MIDSGSDLNGSSVPLPEDQFSKAESAAAKGQYNSPMLAGLQSKKGCQGVIKKVNKATHSYEVTVIGAEAALPAVSRLLASPGDARLLTVGTRVAISYDYGQPIILGCLPFTTGRETNRTDFNISGDTVTGGASDLESGDAAGNYRTPNMPGDLGPGDEGMVSPDGNFIGALQGGVNLMKSGMAEVRTHTINDLLELMCRNYRLNTDMGTSEIKNEAGRVTWSFRGGADQLTESGSDQENWTIRIDLGAEGDLFNFELTKSDGIALFKMHVDSDGKLAIFAKEGIDEFSGTDKISKVLANRQATIKKNDTLAVAGNQTQTIDGNRDVSLGGGDSTTIGNDHAQSVLRDQTLSVGGVLQETVIGGNPLTALPGQAARKTHMVNGSWEVSIGDPLDGGTPVALAGFLLNTFNGNIVHEIGVKGDVITKTKLGSVAMGTLKGDITLDTLSGLAVLNGSDVQLGGSIGKEPFVCGDLLMEVLGSLLDALMALTVPTPVGPSGPPLNMPDLVKVKAKLDAGYPLSTFITGQKTRTPF